MVQIKGKFSVVITSIDYNQLFPYSAFERELSPQLRKAP